MAKKKGSGDAVDLDGVYADLAQETGGDVLDALENIRFYIDTGNLAINYSCSGKYLKGGIPGGRITEAYGPEASGKSLIASNCLYGTQQLGGWAVILDCENATNAEFMEKVSHLNLKRVLRYTPSSLERAFRQIHVTTKKIRDREKLLNLERMPIIFVFDSLTVPPCERELKENDLPMDFNPTDWKSIVGRHEQPGERAKVISAEMRKLQAMVVENDVTVYIINQTRDKIGVMYGCFHYDSRVVLADGSTMKIGKIVNQNMVGTEVLSFNPDTGKVEPKKIVEVHDNDNLEEGEKFLQFTVRKRGGNGRTSFACTPDHKIFAAPEPQYIWTDNTKPNPCQEIPAKDLQVGDKILVTQPYYLTEDQRQVVYGSILGDGEIRSQREDSCAQLRIDHGMEQTDYCRWKEEILNPWIGYSFTDDKRKRVGFDTIPMHELICLESYKDDYILLSEILDNMNPLGLAICYMDDGTYRAADKWGNGRATICCTKFNNRGQVQDMLKNKFGLECQIKSRGFVFDSENTRKLHEIVAPFVHPSMDYKLHHSLRGKFSYEIDTPESEFRYEAVESEIVDIYDKPPTRSKKKFDITVEGNHTYVVDGAIVHNSPETTPGGNAVKFYASLRIRTSAKKKIEHKTLEKFSGINMQVKNVKNRSFRPFIVADDIKLYFENGVDPLSGLLTCLIEGERVAGKGNYSVAEAYLPEGLSEYKFKAKKAENRVPIQVLLDCPKLIDAGSQEEVQEYLERWGGGLMATESGEYGEKSVKFDADGNQYESEDFDEYEDDVEDGEES